MSRDKFLNLLARKIGQNASPEALQQLEMLIAGNSEYKAIHDALLYPQRQPAADAQQALAKAWGAIHTQQPVMATAAQRPYVLFLKIAAAIFFTLAAGAIIYYNLLPQTARPEAMLTLQTSDSRLLHTMADGTQLILGNHTSIRYNKDFGANKREIILHGTAFFDVTKNEKQHLIIDAGPVTVEVKGTAFSINNADSSAVNIALIRGAITVYAKTNKSDSITLRPGQQLTIAAMPGRLPVYSQHTNPITDTLPLLKNDAPVTFQKERLQNLARQLQRKYGVAIDIKNERLKSKRFSGMFNKESLPEALEALKISYPFHYQINGTDVTID